MINFEQFKTLNYRKWLVADLRPINDNYDGFYKKQGGISLFNTKFLDVYLDKIHPLNISMGTVDDANIIKERKLNYTRYKSGFIFYNITHEDLLLNGKKYSEVRRSKNLYKDILDVKYSINIDDAEELIQIWRKQRKDAHSSLKTNGETFFFRNHFNDNNLINLSFYIDNIIVGYAVLEKIEDNVFNWLFRRIDTERKQLIYYIDHLIFSHIYKLNNNEPFLLSGGDDGGEKNMKYFKNKIYNIDSIDTFNITQIQSINKVKKINTLF